MKLVKNILMMGFCILILGILALKASASEIKPDKDVENYYTLTCLKASLLPVQAEVSDKTKVLDKDLASRYDAAASAFNKVNESKSVLELAKKLGEGVSRARRQFEVDLKFALEVAAKMHFQRGIVP